MNWNSLAGAPNAATLLLVLLLVIAPAAQAQPPGAVDVRAFGAKGDGKTDDTAAIQRAADAAAAQTLAFQPDGGAYLGSAPPVYFPAGHYRISREITFGGYAHVLSDGHAIVEQTSNGRSFVFPGGYTIAVTGIRFLRGTHQIHYSNANVDTSTLSIQRCEFQLSQDFAIYTHGTTDGHLSANLVIDNCKFLLPRQVLHNVCDAATLRDCWISIGRSNFPADAAALVNRSGVLMLEHLFGVPMFDDLKEHPRVRWIDNYDQLLVNRSRFGGEYAGIPIVHHFGQPATQYPWMGPSILIENSQLSSGPAASNHSGVITLRKGIPLLTRLVGNRYLVDSPYIRTDEFDIDAFLQAAPEQVKSRLRIRIEDNSDWTGQPSIPEPLLEYLRRE